MKNDYFKQVKNFVDISVKNTVLPADIRKHEKELKSSQLRHFRRTLYWVKKLEPKASEALLIAAYAHDIERWSRNPRKKKITKTEHVNKGAKIISNFLKKLSADKTLIDRVSYLICHHENGGSHEANILTDADSLSFFENNIKITAKLFPKTLKQKINRMYSRITFSKTKKYVKLFYKKALEIANNIYRFT
jgi:predicted transport protein